MGSVTPINTGKRRGRRKQKASCTGTTAKGTACKRTPVPGTDRCPAHTLDIRVTGGRPTKLSPEIETLILEAVYFGAYREVAAKAAGISKRTLHNWIARGEEHDRDELDEVPEEERIYVVFLHSLEKAEAMGEMRLLHGASLGGFGWQAQMTILERKYPDRWGRSEKRIHEGGERPVQVEIPDDAERRREVAELLRDSGALEA